MTSSHVSWRPSPTQPLKAMTSSECVDGYGLRVCLPTPGREWHHDRRSRRLHSHGPRPAANGLPRASVTVFADSSALVKLCADETGSEHRRALGALSAAQLARVEVVSAFWAKERAGALHAEDAQLLTSAFEAGWSGAAGESGRCAVVAMTAGLLDEAARLCAPTRPPGVRRRSTRECCHREERQ